MTVGFFRGFFREFLGLTAWSGAVMLALQDPEFSKNILRKWMNEPSLLKVVNQFSAFFLFLVIFLFLAQILTIPLKKMISESSDRMMGIVFGLIRGFALIVLFYLGSLFFVPPSKQPAVVSSSKSSCWLEYSVNLAIGMLPESVKNPSTFQESLREMNPDQDPKIEDAP